MAGAPGGCRLPGLTLMEFAIETSSKEELKDITALVEKTVSASGTRYGFAVVFCPHTTCAVIVNENVDADVKSDILLSLKAIVKDAGFRHSEGNSAAHVKSVLLGASQTIIIEDGRLALGAWQGIYFAEFDGPQKRSLWVTVVGQDGGAAR
jgi:secondary thiamine-phosphate synthase enzyme